MPATFYNRSVFINCPFDSEYAEIFRAVLFTVYCCEHKPRCALEVIDSTDNRLARIGRIIGECRFAIHDVSRMALDSKTKLPRFNMPIELGLFLGAKLFGADEQTKKVGLVLDTEKHRYKDAASDLSGFDIEAHGDSAETAIRHVRDWLDASKRTKSGLRGGEEIVGLWRRFSTELPAVASAKGLDVNSLRYADLCRAIEGWLVING